MRGFQQTGVRRAGGAVRARGFAGVVLAGVVLAGAALAVAACGGGKAKTARQTPAAGDVPSTMPSGATVGDRDVQGQRAARLEEMFAGRFPGVQVFPSGGGVLVRVRNAGGFSSNGEPLFVLDGQPLAQGNGGVIDVNPNDIARIEVLRSPTDLAMFGSRGGNGVVRITTKRARKPSGSD